MYRVYLWQRNISLKPCLDLLSLVFLTWSDYNFGIFVCFVSTQNYSKNGPQLPPARPSEIGPIHDDFLFTILLVLSLFKYLRKY